MAVKHENSPERTFQIGIKTLKDDGLVTSEDLISYFNTKLKVRNCVKLASQEVAYTDNSDNVFVTTRACNITKRNMKLYLKRYLRFKNLKEYVKVNGDSKDGFSFYYINEVVDQE